MRTRRPLTLSGSKQAPITQLEVFTPGGKTRKVAIKNVDDLLWIYDQMSQLEKAGPQKSNQIHRELRAKLGGRITDWGDFYDKIDSYVGRKEMDKAIRTIKKTGWFSPGHRRVAKYVKAQLEAEPTHQISLFGRRPATLTGRVANCATWLPNGRTGWKCGHYARVCEPPKCKDAPDPNVKQVKVCATTQKVFSAFYDKMVTRCKRYETACEGAACMPFSLPYPREEPEPQPDPSEVKSIAEWMAERADEEASAQIPYLAREILSRGGIRAMRKGYAKEEYSTIPLFLKRKTGLPVDEMANEMGYDYESDLIIAIQKAYPPRTKGQWKKPPRKARWSDYQEEAYDYIQGKIEEGDWPS